MPNWVYNSIGVSGNWQDLQGFMAKATKPRPWQDDQPDEERFSFWNFIAPDPTKLDLYFETNGATRDVATGEMVRTGDNEFNWYNWNINNWGCKWDASEIAIDFDQEDTRYVLIQFSTPWGMPTPVFQAMTEQHPELTFDFEWEEEQGWGGMAVGEKGVYTDKESWDIPNSHADYVARENEDGCNCSHADPIYWYNDCPPLTEEEIERHKVLSNV
jgi:hypothetical protein